MSFAVLNFLWGLGFCKIWMLKALRISIQVLWVVACDSVVQAAAIVRDDGAQARLQPHCAAGVTCDV